MAVDEATLNDMKPSELLERLDDGELTLADLMSVDGLREDVLRALSERDIEEHREIYDRLADS